VASLAEIAYVSDAEGNTVGVIVPMELWREIESERGNRLLVEERNDEAAVAGGEGATGGTSLEEACAELGV
jgi:hypothetical protein